jgi:hypothetical protein
MNVPENSNEILSTVTDISVGLIFDVMSAWYI